MAHWSGRSSKGHDLIRIIQTIRDSDAVWHGYFPAILAQVVFQVLDGNCVILGELKLVLAIMLIIIPQTRDVGEDMNLGDVWCLVEDSAEVAHGDKNVGRTVGTKENMILWYFRPQSHRDADAADAVKATWDEMPDEALQILKTHKMKRKTTVKVIQGLGMNRAADTCQGGIVSSAPSITDKIRGGILKVCRLGDYIVKKVVHITLVASDAIRVGTIMPEKHGRTACHILTTFAEDDDALVLGIIDDVVEDVANKLSREADKNIWEVIRLRGKLVVHGVLHDAKVLGVVLGNALESWNESSLTRREREQEIKGLSNRESESRS
jgi:hypothetical protein